MKEKACSVCLANCAKLHGDAFEDPNNEISPAGYSGPVLKENGAYGPHQKKNAPIEVFPSFLKKMTELTITSDLQMPTSFVRAFFANIGSAVTLEGPGIGRWKVEVGPGNENHSLEFEDGWHKFVTDHILQIGDQLSFTLTAGSYFHVAKVSANDATNSPLTQDQLKANGAQIGAAARSSPTQTCVEAQAEGKEET